MLCPRCKADISDEAQICSGCGLSDPGNPPQRSWTRSIAASVIDATPAGGFIRHALGRETIHGLRKRLARKYLRGSGIEFGALNAPLDLPRHIKIRYADIETPEALVEQFSPHYNKITTPDIVTDIETMDCIENGSMDFVIANHVLEHLENPLRAFQTINRVLRPGGIAFVTLPDKRFSFDRRRPITPLEHLIADYEHGPEGSRADHYDDWVSNAFGLKGGERRAMVAEFVARHLNIHFHVWDYAAMTEMFSYVASRFGFAIVHSQLNGMSEGLWILEKSSDPHHAIDAHGGRNRGERRRRRAADGIAGEAKTATLDC